MLRTKQHKDNGLRRTFRRLAAFSVAIGTVIAPVKVNWNIFKDRSFISSSDAMAQDVTTLSKEQKAAKDVHAKLLGYISGSDSATRTEALRLYNDTLDDSSLDHAKFEQELLAKINSDPTSAGRRADLVSTLGDSNLGFELFLEGIEAQILSASVLDKLEAYVERKEGDKAGIVSAYTDARNFGGRYDDFDKVLMAELQKRYALRELYGLLSPKPPFTDFVDALVLARTDEVQSKTKYGEQFTNLVNGSLEIYANKAVEHLAKFAKDADTGERDKFLALWEQHKGKAGFSQVFTTKLSESPELGGLADTFRSVETDPTTGARIIDGKNICLAIDEVHQYIAQRKDLDVLGAKYGDRFVRLVEDKYQISGAVPTRAVVADAKAELDNVQAKLDGINAALREKEIYTNVDQALDVTLRGLNELAQPEHKLRPSWINFARYLKANGITKSTGALANDMEAFLAGFTHPDAATQQRIDAFNASRNASDTDEKKVADALAFVKTLRSTDPDVQADLNKRVVDLNVHLQILQMDTDLSSRDENQIDERLGDVVLMLGRLKHTDPETQQKIDSLRDELDAQKRIRAVAQEIESRKPEWETALDSGQLLRISHTYRTMQARLDYWAGELEAARKLFDTVDEKKKAALALYSLKGVVPYVRLQGELSKWRDSLDKLRRKRDVTYKEAYELSEQVPLPRMIKQPIAAAKRDAKRFFDYYNGGKSYSYTINDQWLARVDALLNRMDARRTGLSQYGLEWVYYAYLESHGLEIDQVRNQELPRIRNVLGFMRNVLGSFSLVGSVAELRLQQQNLERDLGQLAASGFADPAFVAQILEQNRQAGDILGSYSPGDTSYTDYYIRQLATIENLISLLPPAFQERVAIQFYSKWHEELSGVEGYHSIKGANQIVLTHDGFNSFKRGVAPKLQGRTIRYYQNVSVPGYTGSGSTALGEKTFEGNEIYASFNKLSLETQFELYRLMNKTYGAGWENTIDDTDWAKFAVLANSLQGSHINPIDGIPPAYAPYLLQQLGPKLLEQDPAVIEVVLSAVQRYSQVFTSVGDYKGLQAYYKTLPEKFNKLFADIFAAKDQVKEEYADVRIRTPLEEFAPQLYIPGAQISINIPKHIYRAFGEQIEALRLAQVARITQGPAAAPNLVDVENLFFYTDMIEPRINVPSPFISIPLALSKINELAPDKIPEVGEWYEASLTEAGVYSENESSTQETTYLSNRTNVKGVGEGKDAEAEYTVTRQTRQLVGDAAKAAKAPLTGINRELSDLDTQLNGSGGLEEQRQANTTAMNDPNLSDAERGIAANEVTRLNGEIDTAEERIQTLNGQRRAIEEQLGMESKEEHVGKLRVRNSSWFSEGEDTGMFGGGRNSVNYDGEFRITKDQDDTLLNRLLLSINAVAPAGSDTVIYFERNQATPEAEELYKAYIFKRIDNGTFVYDEVKTLTKGEAVAMYQTIKPDLEVVDRQYARVHPVAGEHEFELENAVLFTGSKRFEGGEYQGAGAAYQTKVWGGTANAGGYGLHEYTRGGRASVGGGTFEPDAFFVGRLYASNIEQKEGMATTDGRVEDSRAWHLRGTYIKSSKLKVDAFVSQAEGEAGEKGPNVGVLYSQMIGKRHWGIDFVRDESRIGGRTFFVDRDLVSFAAISALAEKHGEEFDLMRVAGGGSHLFNVMGVSIRGSLGAVYNKDNWSGAFAELIYYPEDTFWSFKKVGGTGVVIWRDGPTEEDKATGGLFSVKGRGSDILDIELVGPAPAAEVRIPGESVDWVVGGAAPFVLDPEIRAFGSGAWGAVRIRATPRLTLIPLGAFSQERSSFVGSDASTIMSGELGFGTRYNFVEDPHPGAWRLAWITFASGMYQSEEDATRTRTGTQVDLTSGLLATSFEARGFGTLGLQHWENPELRRDSFTLNTGYSQLFPVGAPGLNAFETLDGFLAFTTGLQEAKAGPTDRKLVLTWTLNLKGTF